MATEALQKFAHDLKILREEKGISLVQISNRTKIDVKFLQAIEESRFEVLPEIYIRAFIKEYAQTIDQNSKEILDKYEAAKLGKEEVPIKESPPKEEIKSEPLVEPIRTEFDSVTNTDTAQANKENKKPNVKLNYIFGGLILLIFACVFYFAFIKDSQTSITSSETDTKDVTENKPRYEVAQKPVDDTSGVEVQKNQPTTAPTIVSDSLQLSVQTSNRVWVKIYSDGKVVYQEMVEKGIKLNYRAKKSFALSVGDAGAVKVLFNNKPVPNIGKVGESRNIYMTPETIRYYTISSNEKKSTKAN